MTEWWTYRLASFLMFSPQTYWRLVARHNAAWWPAQALAVLAAGALPWLLRSPRAGAHRVALVLLAGAWAWVGWSFQWRLYAEIFLGARWVAAACALQAVLLLAAAGCRPSADRAAPAAGAACWTLLLAALLYPLLAPLTGHPWSEAEVFGFMPEPTALATLGVLAGLRRWPSWARWALAILPVLSLLLGAATRWLIRQ